MNCQVGFQVQGKPQLEAPISSEQPSAGARKKEGVERHPLETLRVQLFVLVDGRSTRKEREFYTGSILVGFNQLHQTPNYTLRYNKKVQWILYSFIWHLCSC